MSQRRKQRKKKKTSSGRDRGSNSGSGPPDGRGSSIVSSSPAAPPLASPSSSSPSAALVGDSSFSIHASSFYSSPTGGALNEGHSGGAHGVHMPTITPNDISEAVAAKMWASGHNFLVPTCIGKVDRMTMHKIKEHAIDNLKEHAYAHGNGHSHSIAHSHTHGGGHAHAHAHGHTHVHGEGNGHVAHSHAAPGAGGHYCTRHARERAFLSAQDQAYRPIPGAAGDLPGDGDDQLQLQFCSNCFTNSDEAGKLLRCSRCRMTFYCGRECQRSHWSIHKKLCRLMMMKETGSLDSVDEEEEDFRWGCGWFVTAQEVAYVMHKAKVVQERQEQLQEEIDEVMELLCESLTKFDVSFPSHLSGTVPEYSLLDAIDAAQEPGLLPTGAPPEEGEVPAPQPIVKRNSNAKTRKYMESLLKRCADSDVDVKIEATKECRKLLSDQRPPIRELVEMGLVPVFVNLLSDATCPKLQFEAAWVLTNICSGTSEQTEAVVSSGAVEILISLLTSDDVELAEQCVWALGNIAADSPKCRDTLLDAGTVEAMLPLMDSTRMPMLKNISWTMSNLCNGVSDAHWDKIMLSLPKFAQLVYYNDEEILKDVCWSLSCISSGTKARIQSVVDLDPLICKRLVELLGHSSASVQHAALITVGNIVTGDDAQTQILINNGILPKLRRLLSHSKKSILKDASFTISNIAAGNRDQIQAIIDARIIPALVLLFRPGSKLDIRIEATWALANALSNGSDEQIQYLVNHGCVTPMCSMLGQCDVATVEAILEGMENILRVGQMAGKAEWSWHKGINPYAAIIRDEGGEALRMLHVSDSVIASKLKLVLSHLSLRSGGEGADSHTPSQQ